MAKEKNGMVFKVEKSSNYTVMSNQHFHVTNMSLKAKGLLSLILSLPEDWNYSITGLASLSNDGVYSVKNAIEELKKLGYIDIQKQLPCKENGGEIRYIYTIYENSRDPEKLKFKWSDK